MLLANPHHRSLAGALLVMASVTGCTGEPEPVDNLTRVPVAGKVSLDGKPLPAGKIQFEPLGTGSAPMAVGEIEDGQYSIAQAGGPSPGKYRVVISSRTSPKIAEGTEPGGTPKPEPETIPKKYNTQSKLEVDIATEGSTALDFPLDKK